jgi:hypothetical protein
VRTSCIGLARRRYAAAVNFACRGSDLEALQAALALRRGAALVPGDDGAKW